MLFVLFISVDAFSVGYSHDPHPRRHRGHKHAQRVVVVPPPARVIVMPPPRPVFVVPPAPRAYVRVVQHPRPLRLSTGEAIRNAKNAINNQRYDADKLRIAKDVAMDLPLKSIDVLDIMNMFSFESSRVDFAKFAYNKTVDTGNYSIVFEAFKYSSSIKDLEDYIYGDR